MTRRTLRRALPAAAILLALGLAGCAPGAPTADGETAASASPPPPASPAEQPTPTPTAPSAIGATCDTVLTPEAYAKIEADGLEPTLFTPFDPVEVRIAEAGGVTCAWGRPRTDLILTVAQVPMGADKSEWTNALAEGGYSQTDDPVSGAYAGQPDAANGIAPVVIVSDGTVTFVSVPSFAGWARPAS